MVIPPAAALDDAARATLGRVAEHLRGAIDTSPAERWRHYERIPWIARGDATRALDAKLELASVNAHRAVALLDELGHPALVDVRDGAASLATKLDERIAMTDRAARWSGSHALRRNTWRPREHASALEAVAKDEAPEHLAKLARAYGTDNRDLQRMVTMVEPRLAHVAPWIPSGSSSTHSIWIGNVIGPLIREAGDPAEAVRQAFWQYMRGRIGSHVQIDVAAGDLRRIFASASDAFDGASHPAPAWLAEAADNDVLRLQPVDLMELYLRMRGGDAEANARLVAHALTTSSRHTLAWDTDWGRLTIEGMRRLPEDVRPVVPDGLEDDAATALQWSRTLRERAPRAELAATDAPPAQQVRDLLWNGGDTTEGPIGRTRVALEVAEAIAPRTDGGRQLHPLLVDQLRRNAESFETAWHVEYADHGRAIALADTFAALERAAGDEIGRIADDMASDVHRVVDEQPRLSW